VEASDLDRREDTANNYITVSTSSCLNLRKRLELTQRGRNKILFCGCIEICRSRNDNWRSNDTSQHSKSYWESASVLSKTSPEAVMEKMYLQCWNPRRSAKTTGMRSCRPKKGALLFGLLIKGMFGVNKNAAPLVSRNPAFSNAGSLTIIIITDKSILGGKSFEDVRDVLAEGSLGRSFVCGNNHIWPIMRS
jgi:hypothetical protein